MLKLKLNQIRKVNHTVPKNYFQVFGQNLTYYILQINSCNMYFIIQSCFIYFVIYIVYYYLVIFYIYQP